MPVELSDPLLIEAEAVAAANAIPELVETAVPDLVARCKARCGVKDGAVIGPNGESFAEYVAHLIAENRHWLKGRAKAIADERMEDERNACDPERGPTLKKFGALLRKYGKTEYAAILAKWGVSEKDLLGGGTDPYEQRKERSKANPYLLPFNTPELAQARRDAIIAAMRSKPIIAASLAKAAHCRIDGTPLPT